MGHVRTENKHLINCIIELLQGISENEKECNYGYLLNQSVRQYNIPKENWHISKFAVEEWQKKAQDADGRIFNYEEFKYHKVFKGKDGKPLRFNQQFLDEHMIPVCEIVKSLKNLKELSPESVAEVLDTMHICRIERDENKPLRKNGFHIKNRETYEKALLAYKTCGIVPEAITDIKETK